MKLEKNDGVATITPEKEVKWYETDELRSLLNKLLNDDETQIVEIDCQNIKFPICTAVMRIILSMNNKFKSHKEGKIVLTNVWGHLAIALRTISFHHVMEVHYNKWFFAKSANGM